MEIHTFKSQHLLVSEVLDIAAISGLQWKFAVTIANIAISAHSEELRGGCFVSWALNWESIHRNLGLSPLGTVHETIPGHLLIIKEIRGYKSGVDKRVVFQKSGFGGCSPGTKTGTRVHSDVAPERKPEQRFVRMFPRNENRNKGTFAKITLLRHRPFISQ